MMMEEYQQSQGNDEPHPEQVEDSPLPVVPLDSRGEGKVTTPVEFAISPENEEDSIPTPRASMDVARQPDFAEETSVSAAFDTYSTTDTVSRLTLGSALLALDNVSARIEQSKDIGHGHSPPIRTRESVLVSTSEWEERFGVSTNPAARHLALGMMVDAKRKAGKARKLMRKLSDLIAGGISIVIKPLGSSRSLAPVTNRFNKSVKRGERQIQQWMEMGRVEEVRSRTLAQAAVGQIADEAMDEIVENERIQEFILEIVAAQSVGIIDEAIEEVRERSLSIDIFIERPLRRLFRRPYRDELPLPSYDPQIVRPIKRRHLPLQQGSLLGYYAGFMSRFLGFLLDIAFLAAFMAIGSWLLSTIINLLGIGGAFASLREAATFNKAAGAIGVSFLGIIVVAGYFILSWVLTGQTLGMMILGLRVVARNGHRLSPFQGILRLIGFMLSASFIFIGFAWILVDDKREGWQDKIARSYVVYAWDANPDESFLYEFTSGR